MLLTIKELIRKVIEDTSDIVEILPGIICDEGRDQYFKEIANANRLRIIKSDFSKLVLDLNHYVYFYNQKKSITVEIEYIRKGFYFVQKEIIVMPDFSIPLEVHEELCESIQPANIPKITIFTSQAQKHEYYCSQEFPYLFNEEKHSNEI